MATTSSLPLDPYVVNMRKAMCLPEMVNQDGTLSREYFTPKTESQGPMEQDDVLALIEGIRCFGVGEWNAIRREHRRLQVRGIRVWSRYTPAKGATRGTPS